VVVEMEKQEQLLEEMEHLLQVVAAGAEEIILMDLAHLAATVVPVS